VEIDADEEVRAFVAEHGGNVYVWVDGAGLKHVHLEPPGHHVDFETFEDGDLTLHQDSGIADPPDEWRLILRHFPFKHVDALWEGWEPGFGTPADEEDEA
jgi:hypothetical protein